MLNGEDVEIPPKPVKPKKSITIDTQKDEVIPKQEKIKPKSSIKKEEQLKDNLVKDEVLIKDEVEEVKEILEQKPPPTPKLKRQQSKLKAPQPILPPQQKNILPPQQPPKPLYNPFKNYYTIY